MAINENIENVEKVAAQCFKHGIILCLIQCFIQRRILLEQFIQPLCCGHYNRFIYRIRFLFYLNIMQRSFIKFYQKTFIRCFLSVFYDLQ